MPLRVSNGAEQGGYYFCPRFMSISTAVTTLIHHLYANYSAFMLLLTKSQGTRFEHCVDEMVDMTDKTYKYIWGCLLSPFFIVS